MTVWIALFFNKKGFGRFRPIDHGVCFGLIYNHFFCTIKVKNASISLCKPIAVLANNTASSAYNKTGIGQPATIGASACIVCRCLSIPLMNRENKIGARTQPCLIPHPTLNLGVHSPWGAKRTCRMIVPRDVRRQLVKDH